MRNRPLENIYFTGMLNCLCSLFVW